jgi:hypothetical protein
MLLVRNPVSLGVSIALGQCKLHGACIQQSPSAGWMPLLDTSAKQRAGGLCNRLMQQAW